jgi:acetate kinase
MPGLRAAGMGAPSRAIIAAPPAGRYGGRRMQSAVLVINCGSATVKHQLLAEDGARLAGGVEEVQGGHRAAFGRIAGALRRAGERAALAAIGHRVVHGGERFHAPAVIDDAVCAEIRALARLAPLHNPANLIGIEVCREAFPGVPQVAVFDTAFHQTLPPHAFRYAVPEAWYERFGVRRYGFHGTSHRFVAERGAEWLGRPLASLSLITLHLGNGASAAAIRGGRCADTSMGLTPLEGLVMGTRSGDLDPAVPLYVQREAGLDAAGVDAALNHESGLLGLAGTADVRELLAREAAGDARARLALEVYCQRIRKYVGAYLAVLGRADALVFTGGVGENAARVRSLACAGLDALGIALDERANAAAAGEVAEIGRPGMPVRVLVVRTNEELQIARETLAALRALERQ